MLEPIFTKIEHFADHGDEAKKVEAVRVVTNLDLVLKTLGVNQKLRAELLVVSKALLPLTCLTYSGATLPADVLVEGRGVYHTKLPVADTTATLYVKGIGNFQLINAQSASENRRPYPAYPSSSDTLMFDSRTANTLSPRMLGTHTLSEGMLEFINASVIFAHLAAQNGWEMVKQAIDAGVTIPIGGVHFVDLSKKLQLLLAELIEKSPDGYKEILRQQSNSVEVGAVGLIVPDYRRSGLPPSESENDVEKQKKYDQMIEPEHWSSVGNTLRMLLQAGCCFSVGSSHGGNVYRSGLCGQADNADILFLSNYSSQITDDIEFGPLDVTQDELQSAHIYKTLSRFAGLVPLNTPIPNFDVGYEEIAQCNLNFFSSLLEGIAHPIAIERLPLLLPIFYERICAAIGILFVRQKDQSVWDENAKKMHDLLVQFGTDEIRDVVKQNMLRSLERINVGAFKIIIGEPDDLGINALVEFFMTGDFTILTNHLKLIDYVSLHSQILLLSSHDDRDALLAHFGKLQNLRSCIEQKEGRTDIVSLYDNKHLLLVKKKITENSVHEARMILSMLTILQGWAPFETDSLHAGEYLTTFYATEVLESSNISELYEQIIYCDMILTFSVKMSGSLRARLFDDTVNRVDEFMEEKNLPPIRDFLRNVLGQYAEQPQFREKVVAFVKKYLDLYQQFEAVSLFAERVEIFDEMEHLVDSYSEFPELKLAHKYSFSRVLLEDFVEIAAKSAEEVVSFFSDAFSNMYIQVSKSTNETVEKRSKMFDKYSRLGLPKIASRFLD